MIAFDAQTTPADSSNQPMTWTHTCTGINRILFVGVMVGSGQSVSAITYNGISMTLVDSQSTGGADNSTVYLYYLQNPQSGANTVSVTWSGTGNCRSRSTSYTGARQSGGLDANNKGSGTGTSFTASLTSVADNAWGILMERFASGGDSAGSGALKRTTASDDNLYDSNSAKTPPGTLSMTVNGNNSVFGWVMASFAPATEGYIGKVWGG